MLTIIMFKVLFGLVALATMVLTQYALIWGMNRADGLNQESAFDKIEECPRAYAMYAGLRFLGISIMCSVLLFGVVIL